MSVRWKPLLALSGLFVVIALVGFVAIAYTLVPRGAADILPAARAERTARQYEKAKIHYQRALQHDGRNAAIHEELAAMYGEWAEAAPATRKAELTALRLASLTEAARFDKKLVAPRKALLESALDRDDAAGSVFWAKELLTLQPENADALYALASETVEDRSPSIPEVKRLIATLEKVKAAPVRLAWIRARLAQTSGDTAGLAAALESARGLKLGESTDPTDHMALVRLRALDAETTTDPARLEPRVKSLQTEARAIVGQSTTAPKRVLRLSLVLERVQKALLLAASKATPATKGPIQAQVDAIEADVEAIFSQSLVEARSSDLRVYLVYADHLQFRGHHERCLEVVAEGLESPLAALATSSDVTLGLHAVAVEAALANTKDEQRFEKADAHIKALIASSGPRFQGLGHLFQGAIELEQSGVAGAPKADSTSAPMTTANQAKLRASALGHLKVAAAQLPDVVEAQARYGVALVLSNEQGLGRQYLQKAISLGNADPQYQVWAAWSMVQAGYPEEAEPLVRHLGEEVAEGRASRDYEQTVHLLSGEIHQARRAPADLEKALAAYDRSFAGKTPPPAIQLRQAQIDVQLGRPAKAIERIEKLRASGQGGTSAEHLAVLTLLEMGKKAEALETLAKARETYPESDELVQLEAALLVKDAKAKEADAILAEFLTRHPENVGCVLMRAQVMADLLGDVKAARGLLINVADRTENSAPLVQLGLLDLRQKDHEAVAATIGKIRARWKEAAAADLIEALLALDQGKLPEASARFEAALEKDPGNKIVQYWKAQVDGKLGESGKATEALEAIVREGTSKELEAGLTLATAAQSALANLALEKGEIDAAIHRFESLRAAGKDAGLARSDRWQLVSAYTVKGQWPNARRELASILNDAKAPPTNDERVRAANFYRQNKEEPAAISQLDYVLSVDPTNQAAVVTRAYMFAAAKQNAEAAALVRKAIGSSKEKAPAVFFLVLSALERVIDPPSTQFDRALAALDEGLASQPGSLELVQEKYRVLKFARGNAAALAFVESNDAEDPQGKLARLKAEVYRDQGEFDKAEKLLRTLVAKEPRDVALAALLARVVAQAADRAGDMGDRALERTLNDRVGGLIREYRGKFPNEIAFLKEECELAYRLGDVSRATVVTKEIDQIAKGSPVGPLLRAKLYAAQGRTRDVATAYAEALERNPSQPDVRVMLGQTSLRLGETDEALRQARLVLETDQGRPDARLLEARALAQADGSPPQVKARRTEAADRLVKLVKTQPRYTAAYQALAELQVLENQHQAAIATLRSAVTAAPDDPVTLTQLFELLARPATPGSPPSPGNMAAAAELARGIEARDTRGNLLLAVAIGYQKADQIELAAEWVAKAAARLDAPFVHLNQGDILLALAERTADPAKARERFEKAVAEYDAVLKSQANSIEAVNNKAWILHSYLGRSKEALDLASGLARRTDASTLPGEFFDTLGAIQESLGMKREAEESYSKGLTKSPDHPVLNYHMGRLMVDDSVRSARARGYLQKALAGRDRLTPSMADEVASLMRKAEAR